MKRVVSLLVALVLVGFVFVGYAFAEECSHQNTRELSSVSEFDSEREDICYKEIHSTVVYCEDCNELLVQSQEEIMVGHRYVELECLRCSYVWPNNSSESFTTIAMYVGVGFILGGIVVGRMAANYM